MNNLVSAMDHQDTRKIWNLYRLALPGLHRQIQQVAVYPLPWDLLPVQAAILPKSFPQDHLELVGVMTLSDSVTTLYHPCPQLQAPSQENVQNHPGSLRECLQGK